MAAVGLKVTSVNMNCSSTETESILTRVFAMFNTNALADDVMYITRTEQLLQLGPGHSIVTKRNFRLLAYRGRVTTGNCLQRIPITDVDKNFMQKQKVRKPNLYDKEECRDLEQMLREWEKKYMDKRADKLTDKYKVPKREKTDDQAQNVAADQAQKCRG